MNLSKSFTKQSQVSAMNDVLDKPEWITEATNLYVARTGMDIDQSHYCAVSLYDDIIASDAYFSPEEAVTEDVYNWNSDE
jgi:hypothetical protein